MERTKRERSFTDRIDKQNKYQRDTQQNATMATQNFLERDRQTYRHQQGVNKNYQQGVSNNQHQQNKYR